MFARFRKRELVDNMGKSLQIWAMTHMVCTSVRKRVTDDVGKWLYHTKKKTRMWLVAPFRFPLSNLDGRIIKTILLFSWHKTIYNFIDHKFRRFFLVLPFFIFQLQNSPFAKFVGAVSCKGAWPHSTVSCKIFHANLWRCVCPTTRNWDESGTTPLLNALGRGSE